MAKEPRRITNLGLAMGVVFALIAGAGLLTLIGSGPKGPDIWWYCITILIAYLLAEAFTFGYDRWKSGHKNEWWIPLEFAFFFVVVLFGAVFGQEFSNWAANAFNSPDVLAVVVLIGFNFGLPLLMFLDFLGRGRFRRPSALSHRRSGLNNRRVSSALTIFFL